MTKVNKSLIALSLSAALLLGACDQATSQEDEAGTENPQESSQLPAGEGNNTDGQGNVTVSEVQVDVNSGITEAVDRVDDAVVSIINMQSQETFQIGPYGFYSPAPTTEEESLTKAGTGSGVVYKKDGDSAYIVTNNHVIEGSDAIEVLFKDGTQVQADLVGADIWTDLAVLEVSSEGVETVAEFGNSDNLTVGEPAIAIGSPLGTEFASSVTSGIISALNRSVPVDIDGNGTIDWETNTIQTDAAINPGNSGGALTNIAGQVIGINSMKISSDAVEGIGFAIPSNEVVGIVNDLEQHGYVLRPVFGISLIDLNLISHEQRVQELGLPEDVTSGVLVGEVEAGSAADQAGIEALDVIVGYNGEEINNSTELRQRIYSTPLNEPVEVEFYRGNELQSTTVTMTETQEPELN